jgi:hypothetical protein
MTPDPSPPLPTRLESARQRFSAWRSNRPAQGRIPEALWGLAVKCALKHGVYPTVRALGLDYNGLKRRLAAASTPPPAATFVEVPLSAAVQGAACTVEVQSPTGAKLTIHLRSGAVPDLADLARRFCSREV